MDDKEVEKKIIDRIRKMHGEESTDFIELDDTFVFECKQCGKCCVNRDDIILNPFDVYNAAKALNITSEEFLANYCYFNLGYESKIPMVILRSNEETGRCSLLKFDIKDGGKFKCIINDAKPSVCRNHPIGIVRNSDYKKYIKTITCENSKNTDKINTVRDWIKPSLDFSEEYDIAAIMQCRVLNCFSPALFYSIFELLTEKIKETEETERAIRTFKETCGLFYSAYVGISYNCDTNRPFLEQAKENLKKIDEFLDITKEMLRKLCLSVPEPFKEHLREELGENCFESLKLEEEVKNG